jgi:5'-3' exoribonuclease 1
MQRYVEGLQFVLLYYYRGIPSWSWYYDNYYSPLASDLYLYVQHKNQESAGQSTLSWSYDAPFAPLQQLLCVLHPENDSLLPAPLAKLLVDK